MPILLDQILIQTINGIVTGMILALVASDLKVGDAVIKQYLGV